MQESGRMRSLLASREKRLLAYPRSPAAPPWIDASLCAGALGLRVPNNVPNTPRVDAPAGRLPTALLPLAGLMFF